MKEARYPAQNARLDDAFVVNQSWHSGWRGDGTRALASRELVTAVLSSPPAWRA